MIETYIINASVIGYSVIDGTPIYSADKIALLLAKARHISRSEADDIVDYYCNIHDELLVIKEIDYE